MVQKAFLSDIGNIGSCSIYKDDIEVRRIDGEIKENALIDIIEELKWRNIY
mgnify:CR=1 FL=1